MYSIFQRRYYKKFSIVLQGLKGDCSISTWCNEHGIAQGVYTATLRN